MIFALCQVMTEDYAGSMQVFSYFRNVQRLTGALAGSTMHRTGTRHVFLLYRYTSLIHWQTLNTYSSSCHTKPHPYSCSTSTSADALCSHPINVSPPFRHAHNPTSVWNASVLPHAIQRSDRWPDGKI